MANGTGGAVFSINRYKRMERQALDAIARSGFRFVDDDGFEMSMPQAMAIDAFLALMGNEPPAIPPDARLFLARLDPLSVVSDVEQVLILDARGDLAPIDPPKETP